MRAAGWYWVKVDDQATWQPVEWAENVWHTPSPYCFYSTDEDLHRVYPVRIEEPVEEE